MKKRLLEVLKYIGIIIGILSLIVGHFSLAYSLEAFVFKWEQPTGLLFGMLVLPSWYTLLLYIYRVIKYIITGEPIYPPLQEEVKDIQNS